MNFAEVESLFSFLSFFVCFILVLLLLLLGSYLSSILGQIVQYGTTRKEGQCHLLYKPGLLLDGLYTIFFVVIGGKCQNYYLQHWTDCSDQFYVISFTVAVIFISLPTSRFMIFLIFLYRTI